MSSRFFVKFLRILLVPFALLYWVAIAVRNKLYDWNISRSTSFGMPLICVGNLAVGGTGKSPMVEYLVRLLKNQFKTATLSRGYKRKTRGYALANAKTTALDIGDEPMQFHLKFPDIAVAVGEERQEAIGQLLHDRPDVEVIVLDDAFQHRAVRAGLNILLTEYSRLFTRDFYLPTGTLRDLKSRYKKADMIVVTKSDPQLSISEKENIIREISPGPGQSIFFTALKYGKAYHIMTGDTLEIRKEMKLTVISGIANPRPLKMWLDANSSDYQFIEFADHYIFSIDDVRNIKKRFDAVKSDSKVILTTEKDAVRLLKFGAQIGDWPFYVLPVRHDFLFEEGETFNLQVVTFIEQFKKDKKI
jgi:tetraacyldisaccharide 4'-kinase